MLQYKLQVKLLERALEQGEMIMLGGMIFDIIRNSFVDGPGIRTTVFFKGCNLRCAWCHNPESQSFEPQMMFYKNKCTGCGKCKEVCPYSLEQCDLCGKCETYCPHDARKICGKQMGVDEIVAEVIKDKDFYEASGGGVTFSGGECMLQIDFLCELLKVCKQKGIHTAVDTAGCVPWSSFDKILPYTDLFLYDVKLMEKEKHKQYVGVDNSLILENLKRLSECGKHIIIRIPVIGGVNDNDEEMKRISEFLLPLNIEAVELLPYHSMGEHKYEALGRGVCKFEAPKQDKIKKMECFFNGE